MSGAHEGVDKSNARSGLAGARRHDEKKQAAVLFDALHDRPDGLELEITPSDSRVDQFIGERFLVLPNVQYAF
jgi:hypothetical protein